MEENEVKDTDPTGRYIKVRKTSFNYFIVC